MADQESQDTGARDLLVDRIAGLVNARVTGRIMSVQAGRSRSAAGMVMRRDEDPAQWLGRALDAYVDARIEAALTKRDNKRESVGVEV